MDNPNAAESKHEVIGQIIYDLTEDSDNLDSSVQGLFSRVFVKNDKYHEYLTHCNFVRNLINSRNNNSHYLENEELEDEEEELEEEELEEEEEYFTGDDNDKQEDLVREEFDRYWAETGQDIILKLWIEKYKDFVDPAYVTSDSNDLASSDETHCIDNLNKVITVENTGTTSILTKVPHETKINNIIESTKCEKLDHNTENYSEKENLKNNLDIDALNQLNINGIDIDSRTTPEKSASKNLDTDNSLSSNNTQTQENTNGEDFDHEWDILWQNHCLEVYNAHFISFKQDWLKNLAATLDTVNSTTGLEYFEVVKQEVLTTAERQLQTTQKKNREDSLDNSSDTKQNQTTKEQPKFNKRKLDSVASFLNNLTEVVQKYDPVEDSISSGVGKMTETVNNESEINNQNIEQEEEEKNSMIQQEEDEDVESPNKRKVVGDDSGYLDMREKHRQRLDEQKEKTELHEYEFGEKSKNHTETDSKDSNNEDISSSEEEVDIDEVTSNTPASYSKFVDQPNYLLNKLGLHFGSAAAADEKTKSSCSPIFFKSQKLNLFVSKSKFKTLNHRLKIDTRDARDFTEDDEDEEMQYQSEGFNKHSENVDTSKPVNKHIFFNYSDEENEKIDSEGDTKKYEKIDSEGDTVKTNGDTTKLDKVVDKQTVKITIKSDVTGDKMNDEDLTDEGPDEISIKKDPCSNETCANNIQRNNHTDETTSQNAVVSSDANAPLFVFKARSSLDNTSETSFENQSDLCENTNIKKTGFNFNDESLENEFPWVNRLHNQPGGKKQNQRQKKNNWSEEAHGLNYEENMGDNVPEEIVANPYLNKYYMQRYLYWSRYDEGIKMDEESWYSVTPEKVAQHIASRYSESDVVVDAFCGCGGNTIQFALVCRKVIAIDIDPAKLRLAEHNARVYAVRHKIEFLLGDFYALAPRLRAHAVFLSPPWGGPEYARSSFTIGKIFPQMGGGRRLYQVAAGVSPNVGYYLPRTTDVFELIPLAGSGNTCEVEQNFVGRKFVALTAYYGSLVKRKVRRKKKKKQKNQSHRLLRQSGEAESEEEEEEAEEVRRKKNKKKK